jgi:predicted esterase
MDGVESERTVRCAEHGLSYDPAVTQGCVLCRRGAPGSPDALAKRHKLVMRGVAASVAVLVLAVIGMVVRSSNRAPTSEIASEIASGPEPDASHSARAQTETDEHTPGGNEPDNSAPDGDAPPSDNGWAQGDESDESDAHVAADDEPPTTAVKDEKLGTGTNLPPVAGMLTHKNSADRSGAFYLPPQPEGVRIPVLVAIHGTGGSGRGMIAGFRSLAETRHIALVGPDSRISPSGQFTWQVSDTRGEVTPDLEHIQACLQEVADRYGGRLDLERVLILGHSGGASSAPYVATNVGPFTAFAVLHGGAFPSGFGGRNVRGWFSTGQNDNMRAPQMVKEAAAEARAAGLGIEYHTFPGGHSLSGAEKQAVVSWWLDGR